MDYEENSPHQESIIDKVYQRPDRNFQEIYTEVLVHKYLPTQANLHKILKIIQRNVLKGTLLPVTVKEIQVGYLTSQYFKDLYLYLAQNNIIKGKSSNKKSRNLC